MTADNRTQAQRDADLEDRATMAILRQPELNPPRFKPEMRSDRLHYELQNVTLERDQLADSLTEILRVCSPVNTVYQWSDGQRSAVFAARRLLARIKGE